MAVLSLTVLPLAVPPKKKLYVLPYRLFDGLALDRINLDINGIFISFLPQNGMKKAPLFSRCFGTDNILLNVNSHNPDTVICARQIA